MSAIKVIAYIIAAIFILWGGLSICGAYGEHGQTGWILEGVIFILTGFGLLWFAQRPVKAAREDIRPIAVKHDGTAQGEKPKTIKGLLILLMIGLPIGGLCGASAGGILFYFFYKAREPGWVKLPSPPEKAAAILSVTNSKFDIYEPYSDGDDFVFLVRSEAGGFYSCGRTNPVCLPAELSQEQFANLTTENSCYSRPSQDEISPRPPGQVVDACQFYGPYTGEFFSTVVLLEGGNLWWYTPGTNVDVPSLAALEGIFLGGVFGLVVGLVVVGLGWAIWISIKAHRASS